MKDELSCCVSRGYLWSHFVLCRRMSLAIKLHTSALQQRLDLLAILSFIGVEITLLLLLVVNLVFPLFLQEENSKPCSNTCLPSLLLIFLNFSLPQPLTTLVPLLLANLICLLQELVSGKGFQFCWCFFVVVSSKRTLELVHTLEHFQDFVWPSYRKQCSLLTIQNITSIIT